MDPEDLDMLIGFWEVTGDDEAALRDGQAKLARGDFATWRSKTRVRRWLRRAEKRIAAAKGLTELGAAIRQARAAEQSANAAYIAIGVSLVALAASVVALLK
jgi:hypothetical protein